MKLTVYNINDFTNTTNEAKYTLGETYGMTFNAGTIIGSEKVFLYGKYFMFEDDGQAIMSNNNDLFSNPTPDRTTVMCQFISHDVNDGNITMWFKFIPKDIETLRNARSLFKGVSKHHIRFNQLTRNRIVADKGMSVEDLLKMKFVVNDHTGNTVELDKNIMRLILTCKDVGVIDENNNYIPVYENELDPSMIQDIIKVLDAEEDAANNSTTTTETSEATSSSNTAA